MDVFNKALKFVDHQRGLCVGLLLTVIVAVGLFGCDPKTASIFDPVRLVTASQLQREVAKAQAGFDKKAALIAQLAAELDADVESTNAEVEAAVADLERKAAHRKKIIETIGGIGTAFATGGVSTPAAISSVMQLALVGLAGGAGYDSLRKNRLINKMKAKKAEAA